MKFQPSFESDESSQSYTESKELNKVFCTPPKRVSFEFTLPVETYEAVLLFVKDGVDYSVKIERMI